MLRNLQLLSTRIRQRKLAPSGERFDVWREWTQYGFTLGCEGVMADEIEEVLGAWREPPLLPPPGRAQRGSGPDDAAPNPSRRLVSNLEGMVIGIVYSDSSGATSERTIRCLSLVQSNEVLYISAFCKLREAQRSFRVDRISAIISHATGEVHEDVEDFLEPFFDGLRVARKERSSVGPRRTAPRSEAPVIQVYGAGATVLAYLAAIDGHIHAGERQIIQRYLEARLAVFPKGDPQHSMAGRWVDALLPTRDMAIKAMRKVAADLNDAQLVSDAIVDIISADGDVRDEEIEAAKRMIDILARKERKQQRQVSS
jgi:hypothetical protein